MRGEGVKFVLAFEGGRWIPIKTFMRAKKYRRAFAVMFWDEVVWDSVVGWRYNSCRP